MTAQPTRSRLDHAIALVAAGKHADAKAVLLRLAQNSPRDPATLSVLVAALAAMGELDTALYYADRAVQVAPSSPGALSNRARVHFLAARPDAAAQDLRAVLAIQPQDVEARAALAQSLNSTEQHDEALDLLKDAERSSSPSPRLLSVLAQTYLVTGFADKALEIHKRLTQIDPSNPAVVETAATVALYACNSSPAEIKQLATRYGRLVSLRNPVIPGQLTNTPDPDRRLRIGFIGGDFRGHAAMRFIDPLASAYDKQRLDLRCYMTLPGEDAITARLRTQIDLFSHVNSLRTPELVAFLRAQQLDLIIDLAGHTTGHRIEAFHHRIAPLQLTWYGQPGTTGLAAMDFRIADSITDPPGTDHHSVERILRLDPCGFAFLPVPGAPDVQPPPSQREGSPTRGTITFGSYSNLTKLNDATFALWAKILLAVPGSTLILRHTAFGSPGVCAQVHARLADAGLGTQAQHRVQLLGPADGAAKMMSLYHAIDIALDTFPYGGMTTTCEALTMGVPVVSLIGDRPVSRHTAAILTNCGLPDLIAQTPDEYVSIAVALANEPARLAQLRASSRERMNQVISNAPAYAARFESAMRAIWRDWCAAHPA